MERVEIPCHILIVGGSAGGCAAALAAASLLAPADAGPHPICLIEETEWLGGQLTVQGVCTPDEQRYIETFGATRRYAAFRQAVREHYRTHYTLSAEAAADPHLNPGACWVSRLSFEPQVGADLLRAMTQPYEEAGVLRLFFKTRLLACEMNGEEDDTIAAVIASTADGGEIRFLPRFVLDATDLGDLLPLCGREGLDWTVGAEGRSETGEPDAPEEARPDWVQPFTFPFALEWSPETADANVIEPPVDYAELKAQQDYKIMHGAITGLFAGRAPWWSYRRILAAANFDDPRISHDLAMINTAGNDYYGGNIIGANAGGPADIAATLARARRASLGYVYWLQTECPREEGENPQISQIHTDFDSPGSQSTGGELRSTGYPEFRLRTDLFPTADGCSILPYIRESRRIRSRRPILEQEIVVRDFTGGECRGERARAAFMPDTVGVGHYALDIHPNGHGEPNAFVATRPFQIPLGALIPVRLQNLLPACKNLGVTHLTNGAYRLHPIEWNIGEAAGALAAFCLQQQARPAGVLDSASLLRAFQALMLGEGVPLHWYVDVPPEHAAFHAVQQLATAGIALGSENDLLFRPDDLITEADWQSWRHAAGMAAVPPFSGTRSAAAVELANRIN
jgi:hypothetical protein